MKNYLKFPLPTTASWFRLPERVKELEDNPINAAEYDLADFTNTGIDPFVKTSDLPPYKVYTALLTQSGGAGNAFIGPGELTIGVTYMINDSFSGQDFTNVGAPDNNLGTYFVATGTTPNNWGLNQENGLIYYPGAPVVTVLENTIGNIWFTYYETGDYLANLLNGFPYDKTTVFMQGQNFIQVANNLDYIEIITSDSTGTIYNDLLNNTPIEIRVYS